MARVYPTKEEFQRELEESSGQEVKPTPVSQEWLDNKTTNCLRDAIQLAQSHKVAYVVSRKTDLQHLHHLILTRLKYLLGNVRSHHTTEIRFQGKGILKFFVLGDTAALNAFGGKLFFDHQAYKIFRHSSQKSSWANSTETFIDPKEIED